MRIIEEKETIFFYIIAVSLEKYQLTLSLSLNTNEYTFVRLFIVSDENILNILNTNIEAIYEMFNIEKFNDKSLKMTVFKFYYFIL